MKEPQYYKELIAAAKKKDKSELEVYKKVSTCIDGILDKEIDNDNRLVLKALIAYVEGKSARTWFVAVMTIAYALLIGAVSLLPAIGTDIHGLNVMLVTLAIATFMIGLVAIFHPEFQKKVVLCVLNDRLNELCSEPKCDANVTIDAAQGKKSKGKRKK